MRRLTRLLPLWMGAVWLAALPVAAEEHADGWRQGWRFQVTPYLWMAALEGELATLRGLPKVHVDASFDDILDHTDLALMLQLEARRGRIGFFTDLVYLDLSADEDTPGPFFGGVDLDTTTFFTTLGPFYRALEEERGTLDLFAAARVWYVDTELELEPGILAGRRAADDEAWADAVFGARGAVRLIGPLFLAAGADVGGGASDLTWQALGTLDFQPWQWLVVRAGYRHLEVDYDDDGFVFDVEMSGPILGGSIRF